MARGLQSKNGCPKSGLDKNNLNLLKNHRRWKRRRADGVEPSAKNSSMAGRSAHLEAWANQVELWEARFTAKAGAEVLQVCMAKWPPAWLQAQASASAHSMSHENARRKKESAEDPAEQPKRVSNPPAADSQRLLHFLVR